MATEEERFKKKHPLIDIKLPTYEAENLPVDSTGVVFEMQIEHYQSELPEEEEEVAHFDICPPEEPTPDEDEEQEHKEWEEAVAIESSSNEEESTPKETKPKTPKRGICPNCGKTRIVHHCFYGESSFLLCRACANIEHQCCECGKHYKWGTGFSSNYCSGKCAVRRGRRSFCSYTKMIVVAYDAGIHLYLFPAQEAADFYLLCNYVIDHPEAKKWQEKKTKYLSEQLSNYMLYAIGGELRHFFAQKTRSIDTLMSEAISLCGKIVKDEEKLKEIMAWIVDHNSNIYSREMLWGEWGKPLELYGRDTMIKVALALFQNGKWSSTSVGGKRWAKIAKTLLSYEEGKMTPTTFVDTAFALKHNGELHLNKIWCIHFLQDVLNANFKEEYWFLRELASKKTREVIGE